MSVSCSLLSPIYKDTLNSFLSGSPIFAGTAATLRPDAISLDYKTAFNYGPIETGSAVSGSVYAVWRARTVEISPSTHSIYLTRENDAGTGWRPEFTLFSYTGSGIIELDFTFTQAATPVVVGSRPILNVTGSEITWIYYFDGDISQYVFVPLATGSTPRAVLDDPTGLSSDAIVFYVGNVNTGSIFYRQQSDKYAVEYSVPNPTASLGTQQIYLEDAAKLRDGRLGLFYTIRNISTARYSSGSFGSILYPQRQGLEEFVSASALIVTSSLRLAVTASTYDVEVVLPTGSLQSASLNDVVISHGTYDVEAVLPTGSLNSASLATVVIPHGVYDVESVLPTGSLQSASLATIVITYGHYDVEAIPITGSLISASLS